jgi:hypothetical protein
MMSRRRRTWPARGRRAAVLGKDAAGSYREKLEAVEIMWREGARGGNRGGGGAK